MVKSIEQLEAEGYWVKLIFTPEQADEFLMILEGSLSVSRVLELMRAGRSLEGGLGVSGEAMGFIMHH